MSKKETILSIDVGSDSLKFAEFAISGEELILQDYAFVEYSLGNDESVSGSLMDSIKNTLNSHSFDSKKVSLSLSGQSAFVRFVKLPPVGNNPVKVRQIVEFEAKQNVPFPIEDVVWDYQLISSEEEGEIDVVFVVVKNDILEEIVDVVEACGKELEIIELAPTASYNCAVANEIGTDESAMLLNIGSRCSTLTFVDEGRFFVRTIPIAGQTITQQISKEFGIPFADAEELKRRHGFVALGGAYEEPDSEVASTISKIVRNVMTRLHGEINRSINVYRSQQKGRRPTKLYLSGGSSVMAFTPRFFAEKLRMPVDYFNPFKSITVSPKVDKDGLAEIAHMYSDVIGLALRKMSVCPIEISLLPEKLKEAATIKKKTPYIYGAVMSILLCLGVVFWGIEYQYRLNKKNYELSKKAIEETEHTASVVADLQKKKNKLNEKFDLIHKQIKDKKQWPKLINALQQVIPEQTWLISIQSGDDSATNPGQQLQLFGLPDQQLKSKKKTPAFDCLILKGYTYDKRDLDRLSRNINGYIKKHKDLFTGGEKEGGLTTIDSGFDQLANKRVFHFTLKLKLKTPQKLATEK